MTNDKCKNCGAEEEFGGLRVIGAGYWCWREPCMKVGLHFQKTGKVVKSEDCNCSYLHCCVPESKPEVKVPLKHTRCFPGAKH